MAIAAGDESFYTSAGPFVTGDLGVRMFTDMEMPESVGGKRMTSFEKAESLVYKYDEDLAVEMLKRTKFAPFNKIKNILNSSSVVHASLVEDLADLGAVDFKKASTIAKHLDTREKILKPWILLDL